MINNTMFLGLVFMCTLHINVNSQGVSINTTGNAPDNSSMLDVNAADKGILIPRVALVSPSNPIASPATSLLVYNTSTTGTYATPGFYYFNGTDWVCMTCNNSRTIVRNLTTTATLTATSSSAPSTTLLNFSYTPIHDTVLVEVNVAARITSNSVPATPPHSWVVRLSLGASIVKQVSVFPAQNTTSFNGGQVVAKFTVPVAVTPNTAQTFTLSLLSFFTSSGSITLQVDPSISSHFTNVIIHDTPTNP